MGDPAAGERPIGLAAGLGEIYRLMAPHRRRQLFIVLLLMLAGAAAEMATIGAVIPLLALLASAGTDRNDHWTRLEHLVPSGTNPLLAAATLFIILAIVAGAVRVLLTWSSRSFTLQLGHDLAVEIQRRVLQQPLIFHIHRNSAALVAALGKTEILVMDVLLSLMNAATGLVIGGLVVLGLLFVSPLITFGAVVAFLLIYGVISAVTQRRLAANSDDVDAAYDRRQKTVLESYGGIRDVIIDDSSAMYLREFAKVDARLAEARTTNQFITTAPRYLVEMVGMVVIAVIALLAAQRQGGLSAALPVLGALALAAQRLLPLAQQVYVGWSTVTGQRSVFDQTIAMLRLPAGRQREGAVAPLALNGSIRIDGVSFTYPTRKQKAVDRVSLSIPRGVMLALQGPTGSGKSTLLDLLMGLLQPDEGRILIDDVELGADSIRRWHRSIAHVPQSIFLADTSIAANIALSLPDTEPDRQRVEDAARLAQLHDFVVSLPAGFETRVGERGVRLSGGQRQRLGIARAVYKDTPILVFDEATSALDDETETAVISALDALKRAGRTIIIVAHRRSTIRHCDIVARVEHGRLVESD